MARRAAKSLVRRAIAETGSTDLGTISMKIEDYAREKAKRWKHQKDSLIFGSLASIGIKKTSDIRRLIDQVIAEQNNPDPMPKPEQKPGKEKLGRTVKKYERDSKGKLWQALGVVREAVV